MGTLYSPGDMVFSRSDIVNDGTLPTWPEDALIARAGAKGVVITEGHLEEFPDATLYLVRFETEGEEHLGPPVGVWPEELTQDPFLAESSS